MTVGSACMHGASRWSHISASRHAAACGSVECVQDPLTRHSCKLHVLSVSFHNESYGRPASYVVRTCNSSWPRPHGGVLLIHMQKHKANTTHVPQWFRFCAVLHIHMQSSWLATHVQVCGSCADTTGVSSAAEPGHRGLQLMPSASLTRACPSARASAAAAAAASGSL